MNAKCQSTHHRSVSVRRTADGKYHTKPIALDCLEDLEETSDVLSRVKDTSQLGGMSLDYQLAGIIEARHKTLILWLDRYMSGFLRSRWVFT